MTIETTYGYQCYQAQAICIADPFFGPLMEVHDFDYILDEDGDPDMEQEDDRDLLIRMKLTLIRCHIEALQVSSCCEDSGYSNPNRDGAVEIDKDLKTFVRRFADHFAAGNPFVREMLEFSADTGCHCHIWNLATWVLRWQWEKDRRAAA